MTATRGDTGNLLERLNRRTSDGFSVEDPAFVEQVLKLRAQRLAAARTATVQKPVGVAVLAFRIASEAYGLPLAALSEVMPLAACTPVPGLPQHLLGVTNVRGEIRPVMNLHAMLTLPEPDPDQRPYAVFLRSPNRDVGLRVDAVERIRFIDEGSLTLPNEAANGLPQRFVAGITPDTLILLDSRQILALDVLQDRRSDYRRAS